MCYLPIDLIGNLISVSLDESEMNRKGLIEEESF